MADLPYSSRPLVSKAQTAACNLFALHPTLNNVRVNVSEILNIAADSVDAALQPINGSIVTINSNIYQNSQRLGAAETLLDSHSTSVGVLTTTADNHEVRITALENTDPGVSLDGVTGAICRLSYINNEVTIPELRRSYSRPIQMSIALSNTTDVIEPTIQGNKAAYMYNTTGEPMYVSSVALTLLDSSSDGNFSVDMEVVTEGSEVNIPYLTGELTIPAYQRKIILNRDAIHTYLSGVELSELSETIDNKKVLVIPDGARTQFAITSAGSGTKGAVVNLVFVHDDRIDTKDGQNLLGLIDTSAHGITCPVIGIATGTLLLTINTGTTPYGLCFNSNNNAIYVAVPDSSKLVKVLQNGSTEDIPVEALPLAVSFNATDNLVWMVSAGSTNVTSIQNDIHNSIYDVYHNCDNICYNITDNSIWVTNYSGNTVTKIAANGTTSTITVGFNPRGICHNPVDNSIWVANYGSDTVTKIAANGTTSTIAVSAGPRGICHNSVDNSIWVTNHIGGEVTKIAANGTLSTITVGTRPHGICHNPVDNSIWVANYGNDTVTKIAANGTTSTITVGASPYDICHNPVDNSIWVSNHSDNTVTKIAA